MAGGGGAGWSGQMRDELSRLPETAANIREASENLKVVSSQLIEVSAMLTRIARTMEATGVSGGLERVEAVARELDQVRRMMVPPRNLDEAARRLDDVVGGLTRGVKWGVDTVRPPQSPRPDPCADPAPPDAS